MRNPNEPSYGERREIERRMNALHFIKSRQVSSESHWVPPVVSTEEVFYGARVVRGVVPDESQSSAELDDGHDDSQWGVRGCFYGRDKNEGR